MSTERTGPMVDFRRHSGKSWLQLILTIVFACAMGLLEAICVIYLRRLILPEGVTSGHAPLRLGRHVELIREASTIIMLATVAWLAGGNLRARLASFFVIFGVWDVLYYVGLWWLAGWPASILTWDCLFLIPKPWYGPVLAPVLISMMFTYCCGIVFLREESGSATQMTPLVYVLLTVGMALWYWSFVKDSSAIQAHGYAAVKYSWTLFACGSGCCSAGFALSLRRAAGTT